MIAGTLLLYFREFLANFRILDVFTLFSSLISLRYYYSCLGENGHPYDSFTIYT